MRWRTGLLANVANSMSEQQAIGLQWNFQANETTMEHSDHWILHWIACTVVFVSVIMLSLEKISLRRKTCLLHHGIAFKAEVLYYCICPTYNMASSINLASGVVIS
jgi:hypothetical protein